jgi:chemotaxis protein histidine kinase CheA
VVDQPSVLDPDSGAVYDLGGLVGAVEAWASEESVPVNAGRLFRMINDVAALRIDLDSAMSQAATLLQAAEGLSAAAMEGSLEMLETVRRASVDLEVAALGLTTTPLSGVTSTLPQLAKYLAKKVDRDVRLVVEGEATGVDRQLVDRIGEVIRQLVVNAIVHGIESADERTALGKSADGVVTVSLSRNDEYVQIVVTDDGAGIDWKHVRTTAVAKGLVGEDPTTEELRSVLYSAGFSTSPGVTEFTGDGEGLARVTGIVEQTFGTMSLESTPGRGTTFVVTVPAHRALQSAQIFTAGERSWGIPASSVADVIALANVSIDVTQRGSFLDHHGEQIPYASFSTVAGLDVEGLPAQVLVVQSPTGQIALAVDDVLEVRQVATKDLSPLLSGGSVVSGVALLGGDETVMLVDAGKLAERLREIEVRPEGPVHSVLVVDDSQGVRQVVSGVLASHGFSTMSAGSVSDALALLSKHTVDALVVDFSMPRADGVALIHMVRQRYGDIPVVMLSGVANDEDRTRAERAGADAFFDKADFAKGALVEKLRELLDAEPAAQGMAS